MKNVLNTKNKNMIAGFTLAELIIVIAIIAVISTLALFNGSKLNSSVLLSNNAYEIGLFVRDAQISGLGAKVILSGGVATTSNQGVYFDMDSPDNVIFFADLDKNSRYTVGEESQIYDMKNKRGGKILSICKISNNSNVPTACSSDGTLSSDNLLALNVVFKRPNPEAYFNYYDYTDLSKLNIQSYTGSMAVNIGFPGGECRSIVMYKTGAIQVDKSFCTTP